MNTTTRHEDRGDSLSMDGKLAEAVVRLAMAKSERRMHRRHDMEDMGVSIERYEGRARSAKSFGKLMDLSAGGIRVRTERTNEVRANQQIKVRLTLPAYAGICPFVAKGEGSAEPKREWVGWMSIARVRQLSNGQTEVAGRLVDMDEMDRGMLGLYLSTQPLAA